MAGVVWEAAGACHQGRRGADRARRSWIPTAAVALAIAAAGCGSSHHSSGPTTLSPATSTPTTAPTATSAPAPTSTQPGATAGATTTTTLFDAGPGPGVPNVDSIRKYVVQQTCAAVAGGWAATGVAANPGTTPVRYLITYRFVTTPGDTVDRW